MNKDKKDKLLDKFIWVASGGAIGICVWFALFLYANVPYSIVLAVLSFALGGTISGVIGNRIDKKIESKMNDEIYYYEKDEEEDLEEEYKQRRSQLRVIKGSDSAYNYHYKEENKPKLEIVRDDKEKGRKR